MEGATRGLPCADFLRKANVAKAWLVLFPTIHLPNIHKRKANLANFLLRMLACRVLTVCFRMPQKRIKTPVPKNALTFKKWEGAGLGMSVSSSTPETQQLQGQTKTRRRKAEWASVMSSEITVVASLARTANLSTRKGCQCRVK